MSEWTGRAANPGGVPVRLDGHQIRRWRFRSRPCHHGGLDPDDVRIFQERAAVEVELLRRELAAGQAEIERLRVALYHWQTWHRHCGIPDLQVPLSLLAGDRR